MQVVDVLLNDVCNILELSEFMTIVLCKHTLRAHYRVAYLAEILYLLVLMLETKHLASQLIGYCATYAIVNVFIGIASVVILIVIIRVRSQSLHRHRAFLHGVRSLLLLSLITTCNGIRRLRVRPSH